MTNTKQSDLELTLTIKKSSARTAVLIAAAAVLEAVAARFIYGVTFLSFYVGDRGIPAFLAELILTAVSCITLISATAVIFFRFIKPTLKRFMLISGVVSLLIGAFFGYNLMFCISGEPLQIFLGTELGGAIVIDILVHFAFACAIFALSLLLYKPIKLLVSKV